MAGGEDEGTVRPVRWLVVRTQGLSNSIPGDHV